MDMVKRVLIDGDTSEIGSAADGRRHGRWRVDELECRFDKKCRGLVSDISATGMRVAVRGRFEHEPDAVTDFELRWQETSFTLTGRVVWVEPVAKKHQIVGITFENITAEQKRRLHEMATLARDARSL